MPTTAFPLVAWGVDVRIPTAARTLRLRRVVGRPSTRSRRAVGAEANLRGAARIASPGSIGRTSPPRSRRSRPPTAGPIRAAPTDGRSFLDQLESVSDADVAPLFDGACPRRGGRRPARPARRCARGVRRAGRGRRTAGARPIRCAGDGRLALRRRRRPDGGGDRWLARSRRAARADGGRPACSAPERLHAAYAPTAAAPRPHERARGGGGRGGGLRRRRGARRMPSARRSSEVGLLGGHEPDAQLAEANGQLRRGRPEPVGRADRRRPSASWTRPRPTASCAS